MANRTHRRRERMRRRGDIKLASPHWMITFTDLLMLLLCFFVFHFSFFEVDNTRFRAAISSFQSFMGAEPRQAGPQRALTGTSPAAR